MFKTYLLHSSDWYSSAVLHSVNQLNGSLNFFHLVKRSGCALCCMDPVALANGVDVVALHTG